MKEISAQALTVTVHMGDDVVFVADEAGRTLAPPGAEDRAGIAAVLAQAAARLAMMPPCEPQAQDLPPFHDTIDMLAERLGLIGTDQSTAVSMMLTERINAVAETMSLANTLIAETAVAPGERARGVAEH